MKTETNPQLTVGLCSACGGVGLTAAGRQCPSCKGVPAGVQDVLRQAQDVLRQAQDGALVWTRALSAYGVAYRRARRSFKTIRLLAVIVIAGLLWTWYGWLVYLALGQGFPVASVNGVWFWIGALFAAYAVSCAMRWGRPVYKVSEVRGQKVPDIKIAMTTELLDVIDDAYRVAAARKDAEVAAPHFLLALVKLAVVQNMFVRLSIHPDTITNAAISLLGTPAGTTAPVVSQETFALLFHAFLEAEGAHQLQVRASDLLLVTVRALPSLQEQLYDIGADMRKFNNVVAWVRSRAQLRDQLRIFRVIARTRPTSGIDRAMTAMATPMLNQFSEDVTLRAQFGYIGAIVGRDREIADVLHLFEGGAAGALLIGDAGVGKMAIVEGVAQKMVLEEVPENLKDKRLVRMEISSLLSGVSASEAGERLLEMLLEVQRAGNIVMCIPDIHTLVAAREGGEGALNVAGVLQEVVERSHIPVIGTTSPELYRRVIKGSPLEGLMRPLTLEPMDSNQTVQVLQTKVGIAEYEQQVYFSYDALEAIADFARKHLQDQQMPESAIALMKEVAVMVKNKKGKDSLVTREHVAEAVAEKTKIPVTSLNEEEGEKLMRLEEEMHKRLIGQDEAVTAVANALRRARAKLTSGKRPIANFLFVGPTGVGKTELAKTIAAVYFGGEDKMLRFDMSEYQTPDSIYRLIGQTDKQGSGLLTEAVRSQPFSLLLLDELEKADKQVLNLFLQVMDDGRLTDSVGRVVDFTNVILIATSNAGSQFIQDEVRAGAAYETIQEGLLTKELRNHFTPEFINRFDGVIVFHPMTEDNIRQVARLMLGSLAKKIEEQYGAVLTVTDHALEELAAAGFDPQFGARPMRRAIQEHVENALAKILLEQKVERGSKIIYDAGGAVRIE
ncbi:MAG: ATP-dependent Clp protease ATP-binding subunit [Patescibacteria group bacterium]